MIGAGVFSLFYGGYFVKSKLDMISTLKYKLEQNVAIYNDIMNKVNDMKAKVDMVKETNQRFIREIENLKKDIVEKQSRIYKHDLGEIKSSRHKELLLKKINKNFRNLVEEFNNS